MFKCLKFGNLKLNYKLKYLFKMEGYNNSINSNSTYNLSNLNSTHKLFDCRNLYLYEFNKPTELINDNGNCISGLYTFIIKTKQSVSVHINPHKRFIEIIPFWSENKLIINFFIY